MARLALPTDKKIPPRTCGEKQTAHNISAQIMHHGDCCPPASRGRLGRTHLRGFLDTALEPSELEGSKLGEETSARVDFAPLKLREALHPEALHSKAS